MTDGFRILLARGRPLFSFTHLACNFVDGLVTFQLSTTTFLGGQKRLATNLATFPAFIRDFRDQRTLIVSRCENPALRQASGFSLELRAPRDCSE